MTEPLALLLAALLVTVAASGALSPFLNRSAPDIEVAADPLQERRLSLLRSIKDLEAARGSGDLEQQEYQRLRLETESRLARVINVLKERSDGELPKARKATGEISAPRIPKWLAAASVSAVILGVTAAGIARSLTPRPEGATFTGGFSGPATPPNPLSYFEARVKGNPQDVAARLDLAHRYLDAARVGDALPQYMSALTIDPNNAEAHAHMGLVLFMSGRPDSALKAVDRALSIDPRYPEALFFKGVILLKGLNQPVPAKGALQAYLDVAPNGAERDQARRYLEEAQAVPSQG